MTHEHIMLQHYNIGRIKPGDRPIYIENVTKESYGNYCIEQLLTNRGIEHTWCTDKYSQDRGIDIIINGRTVDLKYQMYNNPTHYVHEMKQWSKPGWVLENQCDQIWWVIAPLNRIVIMDMDWIRSVDTSNYKLLKTKKTNAEFYMMPFQKKYHTLSCDFSIMKKWFLKNRL